jgi:hypothetical protein
MKVLLDVGISPRLRTPLEAALAGAPVESAVFHDWRTLRNSDLLDQAHREGFTVLVTSDKRLASEQARFPIAVVAVDDNRLGPILAAVDEIAHAIRTTPAGASRLVSVNA